jgi:Lar family restriction alleviation protein
VIVINSNKKREEIMSELKSCPFCGGEAYIKQEGNHRMSTIIRCEDCGVTMESNESVPRGDTLGSEWNNRTNEQ